MAPHFQIPRVDCSGPEWTNFWWNFGGIQPLRFRWVSIQNQDLGRNIGQFLVQVRNGFIIEKEPEEYASPEFLAVEDVKALLLTAENHDPQLLPFLVLGFYAGMRTCEIERIRTTDLIRPMIGQVIW